MKRRIVAIMILVLMMTVVFSATQVIADPPNGTEAYENGDAVDSNGDSYTGIVAISGELEEELREEEEEEAGGFDMSLILMPVLLIAVFYFLMIRPQRKKSKEHKEMVATIKVSDEVVSIGGIHGKIVRVKDDTYVIESGIGTQKSFVQLDRSAISRVTKEGSGKNVSSDFDDDNNEPEYQDSGDNA